MPTLATYQKPEEAWIVAGYLCSMGIEAVVCHDPAYGGVLLGAMESPHRVDVPENQLEQAATLLAQRPVESIHPETPPEAPLDSAWLHRFLRFILVYDAVCWLVVPLYGHLFAPEPPQPVSDFLASLTLSDSLWRLSYAGYWPLLVTGFLSNILCLFYIPLGRSLFSITMVWSIIALLGPPPVICSPFFGFFASIQNTLASIALGLMYWSPLRDRFTSRAARVRIAK